MISLKMVCNLDKWARQQLSQEIVHAMTHTLNLSQSGSKRKYDINPPNSDLPGSCHPSCPKGWNFNDPLTNALPDQIISASLPES